MKISDVILRIDQLIDLGVNVLKTAHNSSSQFLGSSKFVNTDIGLSFRSASLNFIKTLYDEHNPYYIEFEKHCSGYNPDDINKGLAILKVIKQEIEGGWLVSLQDVVSAEIFSDFLEMADYLLEQNYKDAAAVMIGSVLEEKLRQLATKKTIQIEIVKNGKTTFVKADKINSDLAKAQIYNKLDQKQITAWLDLRNKAAHGNYDEYNIEQVKSMMTGVLEFTTRISRF